MKIRALVGRGKGVQTALFAEVARSGISDLRAAKRMSAPFFPQPVKSVPILPAFPHWLGLWRFAATAARVVFY